MASNKKTNVLDEYPVFDFDNLCETPRIMILHGLSRSQYEKKIIPIISHIISKNIKKVFLIHGFDESIKSTLLEIFSDRNIEMICFNINCRSDCHEIMNYLKNPQNKDILEHSLCIFNDLNLSYGEFVGNDFFQTKQIKVACLFISCYWNNLITQIKMDNSLDYIFLLSRPSKRHHSGILLSLEIGMDYNVWTNVCDSIKIKYCVIKKINESTLYVYKYGQSVPKNIDTEIILDLDYHIVADNFPDINIIDV